MLVPVEVDDVVKLVLDERRLEVVDVETEEPVVEFAVLFENR